MKISAQKKPGSEPGQQEFSDEIRLPDFNNLNRHKQARDARLVSISKIKPSTENQKIYKRPSEKRIQELMQSIRDVGQLEPIVITKDGILVSGHTRLEACKRLGHSTIKAFRIKGHRKDFTDDEFLKLVAHYNNQREKSDAEKVMEKLAITETLLPYKHETGELHQSFESLQPVRYRKLMNRSNISNQKSSMVDAVLKVLKKLKKWGPTTNRTIHYQILNDPPWFNDSKKNCRYQNIDKHYQDLCGLLTRMRIEKIIPYSVLTDPTRPTKIYDGFRDVSHFIKQVKRQMFSGYHRDLLNHQPRHVELIVEKNTVFSYIEPIAGEYKIPMTVAKGQSALDTRVQIEKRFRESGKEELVCLVLSDLDAAGEVIAGTFQNSLKGEFGLPVETYKIGLNPAQIESFGVHENNVEKKDLSTVQKWFDKEFGEDQKCYELEAMEPEMVREITIEAITTVLDMELFEQEKLKGDDDRNGLVQLQESLVDHIAEESKRLFE